VLTFWSFDNESKIWLESLQADAGGLALAAGPPPVVDRDNGALLYEDALAQIDRSRPWDDEIEKSLRRLESDGGDINPLDPGLASFLDAQAPVLAMLRAAADFPAWRLEEAGSAGNSGIRPGPSVSLFLSGARLVAADARRRAAHGDVDEAVQGVNTLFRMARHAADLRQILWVQVAVAIESMAARTLARTLESPSLTVGEVGSIPIDASVSYTRAFDRALTMEEAQVLTLISRVATPAGYFHLGVAGESFAAPSPSLGFLYRIFFLPEDIVTFRSWMARYHAIAVRPYHEIAKEYEAFRDDIGNARIGFPGGIFMVAIAPQRRAIDRGDVFRRLSRLALAVRRHEIVRGTLPENLGELDPEAIPLNMRDPYSGEPMRYALTDEGYVVYSVGEDGIDDGGAPWDHKTKRGDRALRISIR
jgi:hypothetical protein